ncbi:hypothetical protein AHiyo8_16620 [Arthrobacter sp. Hiyo8]|jgi:hypothetical protein|uniref:Uncharacterized protein n=1 Tax=Arthrobacter bambusae TaxID=1338426 RepID=A0AAW8DIQ1_9MICC|nr:MULTISPECIES: hypothetical protein [Arthrobacter]BAS13359.1 hypothetical protein AHiyo8_16620 [Arthrobacter sp. Hiyo8]MDP9905259.1 hypothetical protein [Arthrobacter bambusae]MDQ0129263.1 hypothetical protein [Arthrobacter bambusae]MDQ0180391.1 hypothetical protein [Arthrobacter bambusae]GAP58267.1 hypothetical protein AHiyo1_12940 [Arthrobacter sp. Hiyo1]
MITLESRREWRQSQHRVRRAEFVVVGLLLALVAATILAAVAGFVR